MEDVTESYLPWTCLAVRSTADLFSSTCAMRFCKSQRWSCRAFPTCTSLKKNRIKSPAKHLWLLAEVKIKQARHLGSPDCICEKRATCSVCISEHVFRKGRRVFARGHLVCVDVRVSGYVSSAHTDGLCGRTGDRCCRPWGHTFRREVPKAPVYGEDTWQQHARNNRLLQKAVKKRGNEG